MSQQVWILKPAQDLQPKDLISWQSGPDLNAFEIKSVEIKGNEVIVVCYTDMYRLTAFYEFHMSVNQGIPVAKSGVKHMDLVTTLELEAQEAQ